MCRRWGTIISKDEIPEWKTDFIGGTNACDVIKNVGLADDSICFNTLYPPQIAFFHALVTDSCSKQIIEMLEEKLRLKLPLDCVLLYTCSAGSVISTRAKVATRSFNCCRRKHFMLSTNHCVSMSYRQPRYSLFRTGNCLDDGWGRWNLDDIFNGFGTVQQYHKKFRAYDTGVSFYLCACNN